MGLFRTAAVVACAAAAVACGPRTGPGGRPAGPGTAAELGTTADAPYELAENADLEMVRRRFDAMPAGATDRASTRTELAAEYARRINKSLDRGIDPEAAFENLQSLVSLWSAAELRAPVPGLAPHVATIRRVRDYFARAAGDIESACALAALIVADPAQADAYRSELDEIFEFADALSIAEWGPSGKRRRPIDILEAIVPHLPTPYVVDRLVGLYQDRQRAIESELRRNKQPDYATIRAHGAVVHTVRNIVGTLAVADRLSEAGAAIETITGLGDDLKLRPVLAAALSSDSDAQAWVSLAEQFRGSDDDDSGADQPNISLAIGRIGLTRLPDAAALHCYVGQAADAVDSVDLAIAELERCVEMAPDNFPAADQLAGLYEVRVGQLVFSDRPRAAHAQLAVLEAFHARGAKRWSDKPFEHDLAAAYSTMGRGLVSLGELEQARSYLQASIDRRPDFSALESMGTVALKLEQYAEASRYFELALRLPASDLTGQYRRARILRLAGEAHAGAGDTSKAERYAEAALLTWRDLGSRARLRDPIQGELHLEVGKILWQLGKHDEALVELDKAVDADPDGAGTLTGVVAFLVVRDQRRAALDAYHRGLGSFEVSDYFKVYMSLWVLAEARQRGAEPDRLARDYLANRKGALWYDQLAGFATGRAQLDKLQDRATTRARRAELLYYAAVLSNAADDPRKVRKMLEQVVATDMITFFEYDMAKLWLERGPSALRTSPPAR